MRPTVILLPTDNRPVTYTFPQLICRLANLNVLMPPRNLMGSLVAPAHPEALTQWTKEVVTKVQPEASLICLDSLLYGGLISARRSQDSLKTILARMTGVAELKNQSSAKLKIYAQSSIMRISDNYDNIEEKSYWSEYGREIFLWSQLLHKKERGSLELESELQAAEVLIKPEIRADYLATRARNFAVNEKIIDYVVSGDIDFLIFSQDDSGQFGLNVLEKDKLIALAKSKNIQNILAYPGADEMLMTLIARYINDQRIAPAKVTLQYTAVNGKNIASNYEGQSVGSSMQCQTEAQGLNIIDSEITDRQVDFHIIVHTGTDRQGDHIWLPGLVDLRKVDTAESAKKAIKLIEQAQVPVVICDVAYANGADPILINLLLEHPQLFKKIWSYGGWNTTGNAVGSALAVGSACLCAYSSDSGLNEQMQKSLLFIRLMDDWAYQTQVRKFLQSHKLNSEERELELSSLMSGYAQQLATILDFEPGIVEYTFPWQRIFEVEINLPFFTKAP